MSKTYMEVLSQQGQTTPVKCQKVTMEDIERQDFEKREKAKQVTRDRRWRSVDGLGLDRPKKELMPSCAKRLVYDDSDESVDEGYVVWKTK